MSQPPAPAAPHRPGPTSSGTGLAAVHAAVLLFGVAGLFGKWLTLSPHGIVLGRVVFAAAALWLVVGRAGPGPGSTAPARVGGRGGAGDAAGFRGSGTGDRIRFLLLGVLLAAHWVSFFHAIQISTVALGLVTFSTFPVFTALLEPLLLDERLSLRDGVAAVAALAGVVLVVPEFSWGSAPTRGAAWGVFSGLTFALLSIANRELTRRYPSRVVAFRQNLWAAVVLLPVVLLPAFRGGGLPALPTPREWALLALLGVVFTAGAHTLFIRGLARVRASTASVIATLEPVYGAAFAWVLLNEVPARRTLLGGAVIVAVAAWVSRSSGGPAGGSTGD